MTRRTARRRLRSGDDRGITTILVAILLSMLLLFAVLAVDVGQAYLSHRQSQNASDAAAYAGVRVLDHLKYDPNCTPVITGSCTFQTTSAIATAVISTFASDKANPAVAHCYLVDGQGNRVVDPNSGTTRDLCAGGSAVAADVGELALAYGVQAGATVNTQTAFAKAATGSFGVLSASTSATAVIQAFTGGMPSPFIVCGSASDDAGDEYSILDKTGTGPTATYKVDPAALGQYYVVQSSQVPSCGAQSSAFDGKAAVGPLFLNQYNGINPGNGNNSAALEQIAGLTPCTPDQVQNNNFNGCGLLIPIGNLAMGTGRGTTINLVVWTVWQVWAKSLVDFNTVGSSQSGKGCANPLTGPTGKTAGMKVCGLLLGTYNLVAGGGGSGNPTPGQARVISLIA